MQRIYLRRRIVAGAVVLLPIILIVYLLTGGGGGGNSASGSHATTTTAAVTTTTLPLEPAAATASWHLPIPLSRSVVLAVNNNLVVFGGLSGGASSKKIYQIDPVSGIAATAGTMASAVHDAAGAVIGSNYYVFGGAASADSAAVQQFSFNSSSQLTGSVVANLPTKRADLNATTVNGQTYLVGGFDGRQWLAPVLDTTDGMTFASVAQLSPPVRFPAVAALNGNLYVIGGELAPHQADATSVQKISLDTGTVTALTPLPAGLSHAAAVTLNGTIYVLGGRSGGHAVNTISAFNPATGALEAVGQLPAARSDMGVAVINQTAYLLGGETDTGIPVSTVVTVRLAPPGAAGTGAGAGAGSTGTTTGTRP